jgi:hypothetical protein
MEEGMKVVVSHRGWAGHFCLAHRCLFRLNTLLEAYNGVKVVVSTVGNCFHTGDFGGKPEEIGFNRFFETMAFLADDTAYHDAKVDCPVPFESPWTIETCGPEAEIAANKMHEAVVAELIEDLANGKVEVTP